MKLHQIQCMMQYKAEEPNKTNFKDSLFGCFITSYDSVCLDFTYHRFDYIKYIPIWKVKCNPGAGENFQKWCTWTPKSSIQDVFTWCHYENFGQGQKREGCMKSIPEGGVIFPEKGVRLLIDIKLRCQIWTVLNS